MIEDVLAEAEARMVKALEALHEDLIAIRTGRASPQLVEKLKVNYYGTPTPLNQLAGISVPEPRLITIKPWDASSLKAIERAILESELGLTPNNDGKLIRLVLPQLTEQRRKELVRVVHHRVEEARVAVRNIRRDALEDLRELEKEKLIPEDDFFRGRDRLQELTDRYIARTDEMGKHKEEEVLEV